MKMATGSALGLVAAMVAGLFTSSAHAKFQIWWTSENQAHLVSSKIDSLHLHDCNKEDLWDIPVLSVDPQNRFQTFEGWGAALTDASANALESLPPAQQEQALNELFGEKGAAINWIRVPIGASDFSADNRSCDDPPVGIKRDPELKHFSLERCTSAFLPTLKKILKRRPDVKLMASAWSPPAWMKDNHNMVGGKLLKSEYAAYADYLIRFLMEMKSQGINFDSITVVNEPAAPDVKYPYTKMSGTEQAEFIAKHLGPKLKAAEKDLGTVRILALDDNTVHFPIATDVVRSAAAPYVAGLAYHGYWGPPALLAPVLNGHPEMGLFLTEFSLGGWVPARSAQTEYVLRTMTIEGLQAGTKSLIFWNLALDANGGTPKNQGCENCQGVITTTEKPVGYKKNMEFTLFSHLAKLAHFPPKGQPVYRVATYLRQNSYAIEKAYRLNTPLLEQVGLLDSDGRPGVLIFNPSDHGSVELEVKFPTECHRITVPPFSIISLKQS